MKNLLPILFFVLFFTSCSTDSEDHFHSSLDDSPVAQRGQKKVDICHHDEDNDTYHVISVSPNALPAHLAHGDVQLIDEDGDGYVTSANGCGMPVDCDDTDASLNGDDLDGDGYSTCENDCDDNNASINPAAEEVCDNGIDEDCDGEDEVCVNCCFEELMQYLIPEYVDYAAYGSIVNGYPIAQINFFVDNQFGAVQISYGTYCGFDNFYCLIQPPGGSSLCSENDPEVFFIIDEDQYNTCYAALSLIIDDLNSEENNNSNNILLKETQQKISNNSNLTGSGY